MVWYFTTGKLYSGAFEILFFCICSIGRSAHTFNILLPPVGEGVAASSKEMSFYQKSYLGTKEVTLFLTLAVEMQEQ